MKKELLRISCGQIRDPAGECVRDIYLLLREGECFSLVGNESSGRRLFAGFFAGECVLQQGTLRIQGKELKSWSRQAMEERGVYYINNRQPFMNCLNLAENFFLMRRSRGNKVRVNQKAIELRTRQILEEYGLQYQADSSIGTLGQIDRLMLSIVKAVDQGAKLLVLDEVTRGLALPQIQQLLALIGKLKQKGIGLLISDNWGNWFEDAADCLILLQEGQIVRKLCGREEFAQQEALLHYAPLQQAEGTDRSTPEGPQMTLLLEYCGIELSVRCCEGQCVLLRSFDSQVLEGCWRSLIAQDSRCSLTFGDKAVPFAGPPALLRSRIALWDAGRPETLLQENLSTEENILLPSMRRISRNFLWQKNGRLILTDTSFWGQNMLQEEGRRPFSRLTILCSRWKLFRPRVLLMHNAFSAADRDDRAELQQYVRELCRHGTTVFLLEAADEFCRGFADKDIAL